MHDAHALRAERNAAPAAEPARALASTNAVTCCGFGRLPSWAAYTPLLMLDEGVQLPAWLGFFRLGDEKPRDGKRACQSCHDVPGSGSFQKASFGNQMANHCRKQPDQSG
jgi:hypothetical protein